MTKASPMPFLARPDRDRVLYVIQHEDYSGAEAFAAPVMVSDREALLACPAGSRTEAWAHAQGIPTVQLRFRSLRHSGGARETLLSIGRGLASALELRRILRSHPDRRIVYCTSLRPAMLTAVASIGLGRRSLWAITDFVPTGPLRPVIRLLARTRCNRALAMSRVVADDFAAGSRTLRERTEVVHGGVDPSRFVVRTVPVAAPRAAVVGGISPTKRTDLALDIAARVAESVPAFELQIVGRAQFREEDFKLERELHARVESNSLLRGRVIFSGYTTDVARELMDCRLLLHCRPDEPFGIVLIEAMAAGLPVVAPRAGGPVEIVADGVTGLLYEPGNAEEAARHVARLATDSEEAARMGAAGRTRVEQLFSERIQLEAIDRALGSL